jgi:uncharacterized membrane protein
MTREPGSRGPGLLRRVLPSWRREAFRTTLWIVPATMVASAVALFAITYQLDSRIAQGDLQTPGWAIAGDADAARQVLIGIAAAVITVAGVVFSITILALQLASQQFGPRMLRNFIRDRGTQISLGAFVATFVYSVLTLGSVAHQSNGFVPHVSVTVSLVLTLGDLGVLIYFIHHVAKSIQLTTVVSSIALDFRFTLRDLREEAASTRPQETTGPDTEEVRVRLEAGAPVPTRRSGFLQAVGHDRLVRIAASSDAVISLLHRPGHFVVAGQPLAVVWPTFAAPDVAESLDREHIVGANRTMTQDPGFAIDQLVEVAIRALSPAVNDTFTALNCIDWLGDCLCRAAADPLPDGIYRDSGGAIRLIDRPITFDRLVKGASDKIRQAGRGIPAVLIRQLENLHKVAFALGEEGDRAIIREHAEMILRASEHSVPEAHDRDDVKVAYDELMDELQRGSGSVVLGDRTGGTPSTPA